MQIRTQQNHGKVVLVPDNRDSWSNLNLVTVAHKVYATILVQVFPTEVISSQQWPIVATYLDTDIFSQHTNLWRKLLLTGKVSHDERLILVGRRNCTSSWNDHSSALYRAPVPHLYTSRGLNHHGRLTSNEDLSALRQLAESAQLGLHSVGKLPYTLGRTSVKTISLDSIGEGWTKCAWYFSCKLPVFKQERSNHRPNCTIHIKEHVVIWKVETVFMSLQRQILLMKK